MLDGSQVEALERACRSIGEQCAEPSGFVSIHRLLVRFQARLIARPLLVEGMMAQLQLDDASPQWAVLVDSERYPTNDEEVETEVVRGPLPARLRFTVAHELAHSLAFRASEFGLKLEHSAKTGDRTQLVEEIERTTDKYSPLLLCPVQALIRSAQDPALAAQHLGELCRTLGISREVLINRLALLQTGSQGELLREAGLFNFGIGIGEWTASGYAVLRRWPLFLNFERNVVPSLFLKLLDQDSIRSDALIQDRQSVLCGGEKIHAILQTSAGTRGSPAAESMTVACTIEGPRKATGSRFLYALRGPARPTPAGPPLKRRQYSSGSSDTVS